VSLFGCAGDDCEGHEGRIEAVHHGQQQILIALRAVAIRLNRIERLIRTEGKQMSEIDDRLAAYGAQFDEFTTDLGRELADLTNAVAGNLTDAQRAQFDALSQKLTDAKLAVDTADPAPAPTEPTV
jgi:hypothetical protein